MRKTPYRVAQANLQRKRLATEEIYIEASKRKLDVALVQEPYVGAGTKMKTRGRARLYQSVGPEVAKAAIVIFDPDIDITQHPDLTTDNIVVVEMVTTAWSIVLVSYYFEPDSPIEPYLAHVTRITNKFKGRNTIIGGDANAKSTWWGGTIIDHRGEDMSGALHEMGLHVLNNGNIPTFDTVRGGRRYTSYVDVTACTEDLLNLVDNWKISQDLTSSDHNGITFDIALKRSKGIKVERTTRIYNTKKADWGKFKLEYNRIRTEYKLNSEIVNKINSKHEIENIVNTLNKIIVEACALTIPVKKNKILLTLPWWSEELAAMKKLVANRKNRIRCAAPHRRAAVVQEYLEKKRMYETATASAQTESWKEFCSKQDRESTWDGIYRVLARTTSREEDQMLVDRNIQLDATESAELLARTFYPEDLEDEDSSDHTKMRRRAKMANEGTDDDSFDPPFTDVELRIAVNSFNPKKAPGGDGLTADICRVAINEDINLYLDIVNKCLECGSFPEVWKRAVVVILKKPGKETYTAPKSYRPIGLLPVLGKIYEKLIVGRLKHHLLPKMSIRQYGFMPQRSTEDSLYALIKNIRENLKNKKITTLISLDIEGAFDSAWWPAIQVRLEEEGCPLNIRRALADYMSNREVTVRYAGKQVTKSTTKGCVQGSIAGPILWNLLLDPLLQDLQNKGVAAQAFADDLFLVFAGDTAQAIQYEANPVLAYVGAWGAKNKLKFAVHKTNAITITNKIKFDVPRLSMNGIAIEQKSELKLLGLTIDNRLTFNQHVANVCRKAAGIYSRMSRAAKVSWGLNPEVCKTIYVAAVEPIVTYAAAAWATAADKLTTRKQLNALQRGFAQKMCKAYRTVSLNSALVLTGTLPLDLRVKEAAALYEARRGVPRPELLDREIEMPHSAMDTPHPASHRSIEINLVTDDKHTDSSTHDIRIYTDGSKIDGKVGAALSLWSGAAEIRAVKLALPFYCTVYQAELLALHKASEVLLNRKELSFGVYSDSMAALQTISNVTALHPLAVDTRRNINLAFDKGKRVYLNWIKAHAGLAGNERADHLAKEAAVNSRKKPDYDRCPVAFVKRLIRGGTLDEWNVRYQSSDTAEVTKTFFPNAITAHSTTRKLTHTQITTQVFTGHGGFSAYLNRFRCKDSPSCSCDPDTPETLIHILSECPIHMSERYNIEARLGQQVEPRNFSEIITGNDREAFMSYCTNIVSKVIRRNKN